jgi:bacterioferritin
MLHETFLSDVLTIQRRLRARIVAAQSAAENQPARATIVALLKDALATEELCALRYKRHYFAAAGLDAEGARDEFAERAREEESHASRIAARIAELEGAAPNDRARRIADRGVDYEEELTLQGALREDFIAERLAIDSYAEIVAYLRDFDPKSRALMEEIIAEEARHANDLASLLDRD